MNPTELSLSLLENKLLKEFLTKRQGKQFKESESQPISLAHLAGEAGLARNNLDFPMRTSIPLPVNNINRDYHKFKNFKLTISH